MFATRSSVRTPQILAALVLSFTCGSGAAACTQITETSQETLRKTGALGDGNVAETEGALGDFGSGTIGGGDDFGHLDLGDPDIHGGLNLGGAPLDPGAEGLATREECYAAGHGGQATREAFCRSIEPDKRAGCWALVHESLIRWIGWCSWNF
jgi:hypothetical protein